MTGGNGISYPGNGGVESAARSAIEWAKLHPLLHCALSSNDSSGSSSRNRPNQILRCVELVCGYLTAVSADVLQELYHCVSNHNSLAAMIWVGLGPGALASFLQVRGNIMVWCIHRTILTSAKLHPVKMYQTGCCLHCFVWRPNCIQININIKCFAFAAFHTFIPLFQERSGFIPELMKYCSYYCTLQS